MNVAAAVALLTEIIAVAPTVAKTGEQVVNLVGKGYTALKDAIGDHEVAPEEINDLVKKIVANSAQIQAIE